MITNQFIINTWSLLLEEVVEPLDLLAHLGCGGFLDDLVEREFMRVEFEHTLFNGIMDYKPPDMDRATLSDTVDSINCLFLNGRIPPWVNQEYVIGLY